MIRVEVPRYRRLPAECFPALEAPQLEHGATNEDLARALRDAFVAIDSTAETLRRCEQLQAETPDD